MKKVILFFCCLILATHSAIPMAAAADTERLSQAESLLGALGILSETTAYDWDQLIPRDEFVDLAIRITGITQAEIDGITPVDYFRDVSQSPYRNALSYAGQYGYISGYSEALFYPSAIIQAPEAVKVVLDILGYSKTCEYSGGYPNGYLAVAVQQDLDNGVSLSGEMSYKDAVLLVENALHANVQQVNADRDILDGGQTALEQFFRITTAEGIIDTNEYSGIYLPNGCGKGYVSIDGMMVKTGKTDIADYLGYQVRAYIQEEEDEYQCVYYQLLRNQVLTVEASWIETVTEGSLTYGTEQGRSRTVKLTERLNVLENGAVLPQYTPADLKPKNGSVTLVDNNNDGTYEIASVSTSEDYFVYSIDTQSKIVYDYYARTPLEFAGDDADKITLMRGDQPVDFSSIAPNSILSVFQSRNREKIVIRISEYEMLEGRIGGIRNEEDGVYVTINDTQYKVSEKYMDLVRAGVDNAEDIRNQTGRFYRDVHGEIAAVLYDETGEMYGVIKRIYENPEDETQLVLKIFTQNNIWENMIMDRKTTVNGVRQNGGYDLQTMENFFGIVENADGQRMIMPQVITYEKNQDQTLKALEISTEMMPPIEAEEKDVFALNEKVENKYYNETAQKLDNRYLITANTIIFNMVDFQGDPAAFDTDEIEVLNYSAIPGGSGKTMDIYDAGVSNIPGAVVWWTGANTASANFDSTMQLTYVAGIHTGLDQDDEVQTYLTGYRGGAQITCTEKTEGMFAGLQKGDIIHLVLDEKGEHAVSYKLVYRDADVDKTAYFQAYDSSLFGENEPDYNKKYAMFKNIFTKRAISSYTPFVAGIATEVFTGDNSAMTVAHGYAYQADEDYISLICEEDTFDTTVVPYNNTVLRTYIYDQNVKYYRINTNQDTVQAADKGALRNSAGYDTKNGSEVLIATRNGSVREVFIFER